MKKQSLIAIFGVVLIFVIGLSAPAHADSDILVTPLEYDFGEVEVDDSNITTITIDNFNGHPLVINDIAMASGSSLDFAIITDLQFPIVLDSDDQLLVDVVFSPSSEGPSAAGMEIFSSDPDEGLVVVEFSGVGIAAPGEPVTIDDILDFFDASVNAETLEGRGRGWLAKLRLCIMRGMLVIAGEFIENEQTNYACYMQKRAYKRCDGQRRPYDFIIGESVPELANMISDLMCSLDCKGCPKIYSAILNYYLYDQDGDDEEEDWIEIELVDEDGNPISAVKYKIIYPDGTIKEGTLDANGTAHEELTSTGPIDINFPDLSYGSWEKIEDGLFSEHK